MNGFRRIESGFRQGLALFGAFLLVTFIAGIVIGVANSNLFWGEDNQYGRVPIPGEKTLHLPQGSVQVTVAVALPGRGNETPDVLIPKGTSLAVASVDGGAEPRISNDLGSSSNANDEQVDTQRHVWRVSVPADGDYRVKAEGDFTGYGVNPQLWFGYEPGLVHGWNIWLVAALVALLIGAVWFGISRFTGRSASGEESEASV